VTSPASVSALCQGFDFAQNWKWRVFLDQVWTSQN